MKNPIKRITATEFNKQNAVYRLLSTLETYKSIVVTHHGEDALVIHKSDAFSPIRENGVSYDVSQDDDATK